MRRKQKTDREYEKQIGGFVPSHIVVGQAKRARPAEVPQPAPMTPEETPKPEKTEKEK